MLCDNLTDTGWQDQKKVSDVSERAGNTTYVLFVDETKGKTVVFEIMDTDSLSGETEIVFEGATVSFSQAGPCALFRAVTVLNLSHQCANGTAYSSPIPGAKPVDGGGAALVISPSEFSLHLKWLSQILKLIVLF